MIFYEVIPDIANADTTNMDGPLWILYKVFGFCWHLWNYKFRLGAFEFSLFDVALVSVAVFVFTIVMNVIVDGGWGAD